MNFFFGFVSALPGQFLGKYRDRRAETIPVPCGKDSSPSRKGPQSSPKKTGVLPEEDWKRIRKGRYTSSLREDIFFRQRRYTSPAIEDIPQLALCPAPSGLAKIRMAMIS